MELGFRRGTDARWKSQSGSSLRSATMPGIIVGSETVDKPPATLSWTTPQHVRASKLSVCLLQLLGPVAWSFTLADDWLVGFICSFNQSKLRPPVDAA